MGFTGHDATDSGTGSAPDAAPTNAWHEHCRVCGAPVYGKTAADIPRAPSLEPALKGGRLIGVQTDVAVCPEHAPANGQHPQGRRLIIPEAGFGQLPA